MLPAHKDGASALADNSYQPAGPQGPTYDYDALCRATVLDCELGWMTDAELEAHLNRHLSYRNDEIVSRIEVRGIIRGDLDVGVSRKARGREITFLVNACVRGGNESDRREAIDCAVSSKSGMSGVFKLEVLV